jgi:type I restriction enzyme S subunit
MANNHYALPSGWRWAKLGEVTRVVAGTTPKSGVDEYWNGGDIVWITPTDLGGNEDNFIITSARCITKAGFDSCGLEIVPPGAVVLSSRAPIGHLGIAKVPLCTNQGCKSFVPFNQVDSLFLFFALKVAVPTLQRLGSGATFAEVSKTQLENFKIHLPSLAEQQRIAAWLNERMTAVAQARRSAEEQLQAARALPLAYFRKVFESEHTKSLPRVRFDEIAILQRGYDLPSQNQIPGRYPIMTSSGAKGTHHEFMTRGPGVVTGRSGSIGKVFYVESDYWPHNTALFAKDFKGNEPRYLFYLLQWMDLKTVSSGTGVPTLDRKQVHNVHVPKIDLIDQSRIYKYLDERMQFSEELIAATESQLAEINRLPSALLRRAFAGELL